MIRSQKTKEEFVKYLADHPNERFWQAVRNFSDYPFILASTNVPPMEWRKTKEVCDTFYFEGRIQGGKDGE